MSRHSSEQAALPYPAVGSRHDDLTGCRQARSGADLEGQVDDTGHGGTLEAKPCTSLCVGKGHAPDFGAGGTRHVAVLVEAHSQPSRPAHACCSVGWLCEKIAGVHSRFLQRGRP